MRILTVVALALVVVSCGEPVAVPYAGPEAPSLARGDNPNAPLAVFNTQLRAENERPHESTSEAWGTAQVKVFPGGVIEWQLVVQNPAGENFTMAHIHEVTNEVDQVGPPVLWLFGGTAAPAPGTDDHFVMRGSATDAALAAALLADPSDYYVNLHTTANPAGAIRGDLP